MSSRLENETNTTAAVDLTAAESAQIVACTARLFSGDVAIEESLDPEDPMAAYLVVCVSLHEPRPGIEEIIDRELQWHREVAKLAPRARGLIRLLAI